MPPPRVNYNDLPKAARDQIDKDHGHKQPTLSKKEREEIRIKQVVENIKDKQRAEEQGTTAKDFREMKKRQDAEKKNPPAKAPSKVDKAKNWIQERGRAIAHETQDLRPRGRGSSPMSTFGMGMPSGQDLFGVGGFGGGGGMQGMMGADPFHEMFQRQAPPPPRPAPRKKKGKRRRAPSGGGAPPGMFGGIPKGMEWMF
jgi:hypothetical protein